MTLNVWAVADSPPKPVMPLMMTRRRRGASIQVCKMLLPEGMSSTPPRVARKGGGRNGVESSTFASREKIMMYAPVFTRISSVFIMVSSRRGKSMPEVIFRGGAACALLPLEARGAWPVSLLYRKRSALSPDGVGE